MQILSSFAAVNISGVDAKTFLQGQLSNDINLLNPQHALLASCNSSQGRVQAIITLIERQEGIVAIVPTSMTESFITRLRKYILRSKVVITDSRNQLQCLAATRDSLSQSQLPVPSVTGAHIQSDQSSILRWWDRHTQRFLVIRPRSTTTDHADDHVDSAWLLDDIRAGVPQILAPTYEAFVAQMLNLDALDGISFTKGCYTGQEIIARAHYRGAVKRRMFRLSGECIPPAPATRILTADSAHAGDVVMSEVADDGCEMLAVLNLNHIHAPLHFEGNSSVTLKVLPLPYEVPSLG